MSSEKLIRCEIEREGGASRGVRYVPLDLIGLWEHLMLSRHHFRITSRAASVWVEVEEATASGGVKSAVERVTEISLFVFNQDDGMLHRVCRYVPTADAERVREVLLRHYSTPTGGPAPAPWLRQRQGVWFRPRNEHGVAAEESAAARH